MCNLDCGEGWLRPMERRRAACAPIWNPLLTLCPAAIARLWVLHDVKGYEHQEIARMTGRATGTSKSQLNRARAKVRELLAPRKTESQHLEKLFHSVSMQSGSGPCPRLS